MHPMLNIATRAIRKAGNFIIKQYEILDTLSHKINIHKNNILNIKKTTERIIIKTIRESYPAHIFITNKDNCDFTQANNSIEWIIDPLNSVDNFIKQFPHFAISITIRIKGQIEIVVTYDPIRNEIFSASRGRGAQLNSYRSRCSMNTKLNNAILAIFLNKKIKKQIPDDLLKKLYVKCKDFRYTGSPLLDLAYVAVGRVDGLLATGIHPYNLAGGSLIIKESGGLISDLIGDQNYLKSGNVIAGNTKITKEIISFTRIYLN
ncbi:inositol monophosphatase [Blochmannia endosymbiont of Colobopsis nipponica]|uniref:inositol monophosphatase family protein n=1 Tax=Blochmannia endosymbiont of Colobopsis nipponica TaxID=2681987 RepID=UPI00178663DE|nr:inositol monophosphatase family protein [Blochmannia endosymbiont of Colobopsis nipponica]QOI10936.1 inositol monophosphatase [Blochmannia endosymbiont of Colobopsis nipponica]